MSVPIPPPNPHDQTPLWRRLITTTLLLLNACAAQSGQGSSAQVYGEIKGGVESSHVH